MREWARDAHRLLRGGTASWEAGEDIGREAGEEQGTARNRQASPRGPTRAFMRFLREFRSRNDKALHEHLPGQT
jgi:hypothetical protein